MSQQVVIRDSTQITKFLECEQAHNYEFTQSLVQINFNNPALTHRVPDKIAAGTLGHKYLEIYYRELGRTKDQGHAARVALEFDPDKADQIDDEYPIDPDLRARVRRRFGEYLMNWGPRDYEVAVHKVHEIQADNGIRFKDIYRDEPLVERGFSYPLLDTPEYLFVLEGKIDFIGYQHGEHFWMDHKWQLSRRDLYRKSVQFRNYTLATGLWLGVINYVRLHDKVSKETFVRESVSFNPADMRAWKEELTGIFVQMAKADAKGEYFMNRGACPGKFGYTCPYIPICDTWDAAQRKDFIKLNYVKHKEWKPW